MNFFIISTKSETRSNYAEMKALYGFIRARKTSIAQLELLPNGARRAITSRDGRPFVTEL